MDTWAFVYGRYELNLFFIILLLIISISVFRDREFAPITVKFIKTNFSRPDGLDAGFAHCKPLVESRFESWANQGVVPLFQSISELVVSMSAAFLFGPGFLEEYGEEFVPMMIQFELLMQKPLLRFVPHSLWWLTS